MSRTKSLASKLSIAVAIASVGLALVSRSANGGGMMFARFVAFEDLPKFGPIDYTNTNLLGNCTSTSKLKKIYERIEGDAPALLKGPETPIVDPSTGTLYVLTEEANLVSLTDFQPIHDRNDMEDCKSYRMSAKTTLVADLGLGRPLGGALAKDSHGHSVIYVADTLLGLIRVSNFDHHARKPEAEAASDDNEDHGDPKDNSVVIPKVEIIASSVFLDGEVSPIRYANDVDIGPITGHVYFTDSSTIRPERWQKVIHPSSTNHNDAGEEKIWTWDTMTAFKRDLLRGERSGRLLRYKPETGEVDVLADGIWFANGVAVDQQNEEFVMVTETSMARELKWYRSDDAGKNRGVEVMVDSLPGFPDGAICSRDSSAAGDDADGGARQESVCYAAIPSPKPPIIVILHKLPDYASFILRNLLLQFPSNMLRKIKPVRYGGVAVIRDGGKSSVKMELIQDPMGKEIGLITGLAVFDRRLYMGSLTNDFVGVYEL